MSVKPSAIEGSYIVYDGQCPLCKGYARRVDITASGGAVKMVDARGGHPLVAHIKREGYDLNAGMVFIEKGQIWHGSDAMHRIALVTTKSNFFNSLNRMIFRHARVARLLYPVLRAGRNLVLRLLGHKPI